MPRMSDTMEEGNIVAWLVEEGTEIESGETLAEVETDKATMELDSPEDGVLLHIAVKEGAVPINGIIAVIGEEGEDWAQALAEAEGGKVSETADSDSVEVGESADTTDTATEQSDEASATPAAAENKETGDDGRVKASPLARSMAQSAGIQLSSIEGSGDNGRVVKRDVEQAIEQQGNKEQAPAQPQPQAAPVAAPQPTAPAGAPAPGETKEVKPLVTPFAGSGQEDNYTDTPTSQMRKVIARRLSESKFGAPHFYLTVEINMGKVMKLRTRLNEVAPTKISFNDLVVKAAALSLRQHPAINSSWLGDSIRQNGNVNIGVAVAIEDGLLVPVIRFADMKTLSQINVEVKEMAGRARVKKLQPQEMSGSTFTISNLGMFGIEEFTAIINPPDACILAVGGIIEKPIVKNGKIKAGHMMRVTLSCDHRVVDGASGAKFLNTFKEILEDPIRLMV